MNTTENTIGFSFGRNILQHNGMYTGYVSLLLFLKNKYYNDCFSKRINDEECIKICFEL